MAKGDKGPDVTHVFLLVFSIFVLHIILAYLLSLIHI